MQIYFDFAGYSNMAIGLGIVLGFTFPRNFRMPYTSLSITEFWRRWHMSLSSWLRDYLYIPLGGNRGTNAQTYRNLIMVFLLCGALARRELDVRPLGRLARRLPGDRAPGAESLRSPGSPAPARWAYALLAVMGGWVLFRSADLPEAIGYYASLFGRNGLSEISFDMHDALNERAIMTLSSAACSLLRRDGLPSGRRRSFVRAPADVALTFALLIFSMITVAAGAYSPFLYFGSDHDMLICGRQFFAELGFFLFATPLVAGLGL